MAKFNNDKFDVVIMGGGPAGATLAARLANETDLSVVVFEAEAFPRDHIGESFVHTVVPSLQASGALPKVLASECWVKKYGGYYAWDPEHPWATYFEHTLHERDGFLRWAIHVDRAEFDKILLDHAKDCGAQVFEETPVTGVRREDGTTTVDLGDKGQVRCTVFVNSSGRHSNTMISGEKTFLSEYRNIAIWGHVLNGKPAQTLEGDWNIFRDKNLSPIGSFAFDDGWVWYIPVPKIIDGKRVRTHSIGIVTDPSALEQPGKNFRDPEVFVSTIKQIPLLQDLVGDIELISDGKLNTATNYSRISGKMCDWETKEIRVGDAAYFVDPLFSSGVHFALIHAAAAALLIKAIHDPNLDEASQRALWVDYDKILANTARGFAQGIDQWYYEIARGKPNSVYWNARGDSSTFDRRSETFHALVNGAVHSDLIQVIGRGSHKVDSLSKGGTLRESMEEIHASMPAPTAKVKRRPNLVVSESLTLEPGLPFPDGSTPKEAAPPGKPLVFVHGPYWDDPERHAAEVMGMFDMPVPCHRIRHEDEGGVSEVKFVQPFHNGLELLEMLEQPQVYGELEQQLHPLQRNLLAHMALAGMLEVSA